MKYTIISFSPTKTSEKVTKAIMEGMTDHYEFIDITSPEKRAERLSFKEEDVVIIGAPIYAGRLPDFVAEYFNTMDGDGSLAVPVVVYGNRHYDDALLELNDLLNQRGFKTIGAGIFIGEHSYSKDLAAGRPDENDLKIAYELGQKITLNEKTFDIPGNRPYREVNMGLPIGPMTLESCIACGVCYKACPVGAIDSINFLADENKCIRCHACVKFCPKEAKQFDDRLNPIRERLKTLCAERKEPIIFY